MIITRNPIVLGRWLMAVGVTLGSLGAVGCGDDDDDAAPTTEETTPADPGGVPGGGASDVAYTVESAQYGDVAAPAGGTIAIQNLSGTPHTFTADDGSFDVSYGAAENATVDVPDEPGDYAFHCTIHASMQATLTVG